MPAQKKAGIAFAHGIWADGSCFQKLIPALRAGGGMDQFVGSQNVERYRSLLEHVTDESNRQQIINLLAEEKQKDAGDRVW